MAKLFVLIILGVAFGIGLVRQVKARHVHPKENVESLDENGWEDTIEIAKYIDKATIKNDFDGIPIEVISNMKPSRFVPINNELFFKRYLPCEEGFKRDLLGVCREVWD